MDQRAFSAAGSLATLAIVLIATAGGQESPARPSPGEAILRALAADPVTAPYRFSTRIERGKVVLSGRVATKTIYDAAVRNAIATGVPFQDRLVIDTAEATRPNAIAVAPASPIPRAIPLSGVPSTYVYPEPLFGYVDEPFYGFEPPLISYPPWWVPRSPEPPLGAAAPAVDDATSPTDDPPGRSVELTIDPLGFGVLRGKVATQEEKDGIGARAEQLPGLRGIVNRIEVVGEQEAIDPEAPPAPPEAGDVDPPPPPVPEDEPPPPPVPFEPPAPEPRPTAATSALPAAPGLVGQVGAVIARDPALSNASVRVSQEGEALILSGRVASAYEALRAFRAAQRTPGVRNIVDRLEFPLPEPGQSNPLATRAQADDLEPYLLFQLQRHLGDRAHLDRVTVEGRRVEVRGTVRSDAERPRVAALVQALPILRGFQVDPSFDSL